MATTTLSMPKGVIRSSTPRAVGDTRLRSANDTSEELKEFWRLADEGYRQSLAMGLTDETIENFIDEVIHEGREILESVEHK